MNASDIMIRNCPAMALSMTFDAGPGAATPCDTVTFQLEGKIAQPDSEQFLSLSDCLPSSVRL